MVSTETLGKAPLTSIVLTSYPWLRRCAINHFLFYFE